VTEHEHKTEPKIGQGNINCPYHGTHGLYQGRDCYYCIIEGRIPVKSVSAPGVEKEIAARDKEAEQEAEHAGVRGRR
jgi:hypothetical protein